MALEDADVVAVVLVDVVVVVDVDVVVDVEALEVAAAGVDVSTMVIMNEQSLYVLENVL